MSWRSFALKPMKLPAYTKKKQKGGMTSTFCHSISMKGNKFSSTIPDLNYSLASWMEVYDVIVKHGWEKFARHPDEKDLKKKSINVTLVKEFYAHFTDPNQGTVYVRAERVEFKAKAINKFFAIKKTADLNTPFVKGMKDQNIDFLLENLCFQGAVWDEANTTMERDRVKPAAKLWRHFLKQNLMPTTHMVLGHDTQNKAQRNNKN
ncbi:hypothetical protein V6N13_037482 [Hibiscus sabdariffa]